MPALAINALLFYGLWQMGDFQKQERPWRHALDRAQLLALVILGLCPFIYWHNKMPGQTFFTDAVMLLELSAVLFLFDLNLVLKRLGAMLPDETLRRRPASSPRSTAGCWCAAVFCHRFHRLCAMPHPSLPSEALDLAEPGKRPAADFFHPAAAGHDDGADLENQGSHPRRRFRFARLKFARP